MRRNQQSLWALIVTGSMFLSGCSAVSTGRADLDLGMKERGIASWYGADFHGGPRRMVSSTICKRSPPPIALYR
jgi:hypothetical protein